MSKKVAVIIVAAGQGLRARADAGSTPKQYRRLAGIPVLQRSIEAFTRRSDVGWVLPVIGADHGDRYAGLDLVSDNLLAPVAGGTTRQESVLAGLTALQHLDPDIVLIHDAARPLVSEMVINNVVRQLPEAGAVLPVVPVVDTIKRSRDGQYSAGTEKRNELRAAQTPQGFAFADIFSAHVAAAQSGLDFTDDAAIAEWAGMKVMLVDGHANNIKVTRSEDFELAAFFMAGNQTLETRMGTGLDIHRFEPGDHVRLAEVDIPHNAKLAGHSDADIALHALTDALLGALAEGDIGTHFPPGDAQWKGVASRTFLAFATDRLRARRGRIVHLDLTLMCEAPKIAPHAAQMRANIADICAVDIARVSVKAGTAEKLGFAGRGEGMFAQASATIELPRGED